MQNMELCRVNRKRGVDRGCIGSRVMGVETQKASSYCTEKVHWSGWGLILET